MFMEFFKYVIFVCNSVPHSSIGVISFSYFTENPSLRNVRVFICTEYVLRLPQGGSNFESSAIDRVYLETLEHGVYKVLVTDGNGNTRVVKTHHVNVDKKLPGAPSSSPGHQVWWTLWTNNQTQIKDWWLI